MDTLAYTAWILTALLGASGVGMGAFGAHALKAVLSPGSQALWQTASHYHLLHAAALGAAAAACSHAQATATGPWRALCVGGLALGTCLFSGSLYALALGAPKALGVLTPLGGLLLIGGWLALIGVVHGR